MGYDIRWNPALKGRKRWGRTNRYNEVEFVCVNSCQPEGVSQEAQDSLYEYLRERNTMADIAGRFLIYRQDFSDEDCTQIALAVIILVPIGHQDDSFLLDRAEHMGELYGVPVDVVNERDDEFIDSVLRSESPLEFLLERSYVVGGNIVVV